MNPAHAAAHLSILHTMAVYHTAIDRGDFAELASAFVEDGVMDLTGGSAYSGRGAIQEGMRARTMERLPPDAGAVFQRHHLTTRRIDLAWPDSASCLSYFLVLTELGLDHCGRYFDTFVAVGEDWLIRRRRAQLDWMHPQSRFRVNTGRRTGDRNPRGA